MESTPALNNADDTAELIRSLKDSEDISHVRNGLVRAVIFLRTEKQIRGARTESVAHLPPLLPLGGLLAASPHDRGLACCPPEHASRSLS